MITNDPELHKIVRERIPVIIDDMEFIVQRNPLGSCDGCYYLGKECPNRARAICCSNGGNILVLKPTNK